MLIKKTQPSVKVEFLCYLVAERVGRSWNGFRKIKKENYFSVSFPCYLFFYLLLLNHLRIGK